MGRKMSTILLLIFPSCFLIFAFSYLLSGFCSPGDRRVKKDRAEVPGPKHSRYPVLCRAFSLAALLPLPDAAQLPPGSPFQAVTRVPRTPVGTLSPAGICRGRRASAGRARRIVACSCACGTDILWRTGMDFSEGACHRVFSISMPRWTASCRASPVRAPRGRRLAWSTVQKWVPAGQDSTIQVFRSRSSTSAKSMPGATCHFCTTRAIIGFGDLRLIFFALFG